MLIISTFTFGTYFLSSRLVNVCSKSPSISFFSTYNFSFHSCGDTIKMLN
ncbi:hypothetical protein LEQ41_02745 [Streptococcus agalactiae]|nr:hypothetical protein [Streptococcus agalactiae]